MQFESVLSFFVSLGLLLSVCGCGSSPGSKENASQVASSPSPSPLVTPHKADAGIQAQSVAGPSGSVAVSNSRDPADPGRTVSRIPHPAGGKKATAPVIEPRIAMPDLIPNPPESTSFLTPVELFKGPPGYPTLVPKIQGFVSERGIKEVADFYLKSLPGVRIQEAAKSDLNSKILVLPANKEGCVSITLTQKNGKTLVLKTILPKQPPVAPKTR